MNQRSHPAVNLPQSVSHDECARASTSEPTATAASTPACALPNRPASDERAGSLTLQLAGAPLRFLGDGAAFEPASGSLLVADLHLGKAEAFGRGGLPVPGAVNGDTLTRLRSLCQRIPASRLIVLGDLMHAALPESHPLFGELRNAVRGLPMPIAVVAGNHDRQAHRYADLLGIELLAEPVRAGPFLLRHEPVPERGLHVLAGHIHPVLRLVGRADSLRLPCFWLRDGLTVLPAFGAFTGGWTIRPQPGERALAIDGQRVHEIPVPPRERGRHAPLK
ncbi:MAG: ligase-associated DNA damage response endonuclease PdeM [Burkholderiaceae bacterium]